MVQVYKKAQTIMKQADKDGDGTISLEEFEVIAEKFPNILVSGVASLLCCPLLWLTPCTLLPLPLSQFPNYG